MPSPLVYEALAGSPTVVTVGVWSTAPPEIFNNTPGGVATLTYFPGAVTPVPPGTYFVAVHYTPFANRSSQTQHQIKDGSTVLATISLDQTDPAVLSYHDLGEDFAPLGTYTFSGVPSVVIWTPDGGGGSGNYAIAIELYLLLVPTTWTTQRSGNWNVDAANVLSPWNGGGNPASGVPGSGDLVITATGHVNTIPLGYNAVIGNSPSASGVVLTVQGTGSLIVNGSLRVLGSVAFTDTSNAFTANAGSTVFLDGSGNIGQRYNFGFGALTRISFNGSSGAHVTVKSTTSGGATPGTFLPNNGFYSGGVTATYADFQYIGDAETIGWQTNLNQNYGGSPSLDWICLPTHCTFDHCGEIFFGSANACVGSRFELTSCVWTNSLADNASNLYTLNFSPNAAPSGGGTSVIAGCAFDKFVFLRIAGVTFTSNVFYNSLQGSGTVPWALFDDNMVRQTHLAEFSTYGDITNSLIYYDDPTQVNGHVLGISPVAASSVNVTGNVLFSNAVDAAHGTRGIYMGAMTNANTPVNIRLNIALYNGTDQGMDAAFSVANGDDTTQITIEHNTFCVERHSGHLVGHLQTVADTTTRYRSVKGNLYLATTGSHGSSGNDTLVVVQSDGPTQPLSDLIPAANVAYNGQVKINGTSSSAFTNQANGYAENLTSASPAVGATDVILSSVVFHVTSASAVTFNALAAWDLSLGGPGTEASAKAGLLAGTAGYTTAGFLAYVRAAYRPGTVALSAAFDATHAFPGDTTTTDAAGNPMGGTIGAMAYQSIDATSYTLIGPSSGIVSVASSNFTVTPVGGIYTGIITPHSTGSGIFTPSSLTFSGTSAPQTFTYTPSTIIGSPHTITTTASPTLGTDPTGIAYTVNLAPATTYTITAPSPPTGSPNVPSGNFTIMPNGPFTGTITPSDGGGGGTFTPPSLTWASSSIAKTFRYTPASIGVKTISATNDGGLTNGSPVMITVSFGQKSRLQVKSNHEVPAGAITVGCSPTLNTLAPGTPFSFLAPGDGSPAAGVLKEGTWYSGNEVDNSVTSNIGGNIVVMVDLRGQELKSYNYTLNFVLQNIANGIYSEDGSGISVGSIEVASGAVKSIYVQL